LPDPTQLCSAVAGIAGDMFKVTLNGFDSALELAEAVLTPNPFGERVPTSYTPGHPPTTTTRRSGRSPLRSARSASSFPSL